jgi:hypothetical protein
LVVIGVKNGLAGELNIYFRVVKLIMPLLLTFSVPRFITSIDESKKLFDLIFPIFITAFAAQLFTVFTGFSPANNFFLPENQAEMQTAGDLRSFYNPGITLLSLLASLFYLSIKDRKYYTKMFLFVIVGMTFFMSFLSASRGWIICMGLVIILYLIFVEKGKNLGGVIMLFLLIIAIGMTNEKIRVQTFFAMERFMTLEKLAAGDATAGGTLARLDERGPKVMSAWAQNPIFGCGFSNIYFEEQDGHVGNQNILLHAGIVGFSLLMIFFIYVNAVMFSICRSFNERSKYKNTPLVFIVFFIGYFIIHSSSGQHFGFMGYPNTLYPQAVFLAMSSVIFNINKAEEKERKQLKMDLYNNFAVQ